MKAGLLRKRKEMREKQIYNPYLPSYEYVPDGEPHIFGDRIYLYGSHDRFDGADFCLNDYVCYSADVHDLTDWKYEGVIYRKEQDPRNQNIPADAFVPKRGFCAKEEKREGDLNGPGIHAMWAPDVVKGPDGRYYLYYCFDWLPEIAVAVCDTPGGKYEYLGLVRHEDGTVLGQREGDYSQFDPGIFVDDDGTVYLYSGNAPMKKEQENGTQASQVMVLSTDMLTIAVEPKKLIPSVCESEGTGFEGHEFLEASSIRKIENKYYFVYSSVNGHELCYAVSDRPDEGYRFSGTLVDIGDVYLEGREEKDAVNCLGNTHGGMECADGQWYIFYHRQTNRTNYSRQACAEKIYFEEDGSIRQAEVTSCGLNKGPLEGEGVYPANICCYLRAKKGVAFSSPQAMKMDYPYLTQDAEDMEPESEAAKQEAVMPVQYIANIRRGDTAGYKYFRFHNLKQIALTLRGEAEGEFLVRISPEGEILGRIPVCSQGNDWNTYAGEAKIPEGIHPLYLCFEGSGSLDLIKLHLDR